MRCASCGAELIAGKKFCHACGVQVASRCAGCGATMDPGFRFCPDCGLPVGAAVHDAPPPPVQDPLARLSRHIPEGLAHKIRATRGVIEGERKLVTVLFCDLVGSTQIAERLDPEEYHDLLDRYLELAFREIYRFEGVVNQLAGDGLMALFGAPVAHEDAPQRAIRAALAIREALVRFGDDVRATRGIELRARIGIHTGPVVVGTVGNDLKMDYTAIGDTTNLAARLESLAPPGSILISDATQRLVRSLFEVRPTGPLEVRGKSERVAAFEVLGRSEVTWPMAIAAERGLTPLVGRSEELAQLDAAYRRMTAGQPQVVAVVGEAGIGKSRLIHEFKRRLGDEPAFLEGRCSSMSHNVPYHPFLSMLRRYFGLVASEDPAAAAAKVEAILGVGLDQLARDYPLMCRFLSLIPGTADAGELPAEEFKRESFNAIARLVLAESHDAPVVVIIEDLHWIDDASLELLESLLARLGSAREMVVVSHRPDLGRPWRVHGAFTQLVLGRLSDDEITAMIRSVAGGKMPAELERLLVTKAGGSPFFAEELTRVLVEEGYLVRNNGDCRLTRPLEEIPIPGTVQEVIAARLDRLPPQAKRVIQVAAVLGRQFSRAQLAELLANEGIDVAHELEELERRGLLHRKDVLSNDEFRFGESLTQEVAYEGLLLKQRRQLHERIGLLLEASPADGGPERSAVLAHHFSRGDDPVKAVEALLRAAQDAERLPSYRAATEFYERAWELAEKFPTPADEPVRRLTMHAALDFCRSTVLFSSTHLDRAAEAARRGRELAEALGDTEALTGFLYFHGSITFMRDPSQFARGVAMAEEALAIAQRAELVIPAMRISRGLCFTYVADGRFELAQRAVGWVLHELERSGHRERLTDIYIGSRWVRESVLYASDELDAAEWGLLETGELAVKASNRTVRNAVASTLNQIHFLRGEYAEAKRLADASLELAEEIGNVAALPSSAAVALLSRMALGEEVATGRYIDLIEQGLVASGYSQPSIRFVIDAFLAVGDLARAERHAGELRQRASGRLREALAELAFGDVCLRHGPARFEEAQRSIDQALALAEAMGARSVQAAATLSAAELAAAREDRVASVRRVERVQAICRELRLGRYLPRIERLQAALN